MTTLFIPMPEWQATNFLRDRRKTMERLLRSTPLFEPRRRILAGYFQDELILEGGVLTGFRNRADAVNCGNRQDKTFAVVRLVIADPLAETLARPHHIMNWHQEPRTGAPQIKIDVFALTKIADVLDDRDTVQILIEDIITPPESQADRDRRYYPGGCDAGYIPPPEGQR